MIKLLNIFGLFFLCLNAKAQFNCGTPTPSQQWEDAFSLKVKEHKIKSVNSKNKASAITIPVIVHILHFGQPVGTYPNLAQGQINSEITVLNNDFAGNGYNVSNVPSIFNSLISNTGINFCLAQLDTNGNTLAEPGIDRINLSVANYTSYGGPLNPTAYTTTNDLVNFIDGVVKPNTIWNPTRYLNIWISDKNASVGLRGFAKFPYIASGTLTGLPLGDIATNANDGVWMLANSFGSKNIFPSGTYDPVYTKGNVVAHEIGHWLGLRHIWADATCGDDYCNDTPPAQSSNSGYPIHPHNIGVCSGNTTGELFYNYMDYSTDSCITLFTNDQNIRMQTALAFCPNRNQLAQSSATLCFPVPTAPTASIAIADTICANAVITATNLSYDNPLAPLSISYSWSAIPNTGVTFSPNNSVASPSISFTFPGSYFISLVATNTVGANSTMQSINVNFCTTTNLNTASFKDLNSLLCPNPTTGKINVLIDDLSTLNAIQIFDVTGKLVYTSNLVTYKTEINSSEWPSGLYIYKIISNTILQDCGKLVKQ